MTTTGPQPHAGSALAQKRSLLIFLPLLVFAAIAGLFLIRLFAGDASRLPSALIAKPIPPFSLPGVDGLPGQAGLSDADLRQGKVTVVNVFASWCVPCRQEHETLMRLSRDPALAGVGARLVGLAYKDDPDNVLEFLGKEGDPYAAIGADAKGRVAIDFGVYGVPETFIIKGDGVIAYRFVGPISDEIFEETILPEIKKAQSSPAPLASANPPR
jgi:cytochrome c biogenesis protein CcmG/thiol:disulfide interchange protein DsbE